MSYLIALLFIVLLSLFSRLSAENYDDGVQAIKRGNYATAFSEWKSMAEMAQAKAQYDLGAMYAGGLGTSQNNTEAV
ncbi:MAG: hypothetical protein VCB60_03410, partial [Alphaproteobacteria bacterium]